MVNITAGTLSDIYGRRKLLLTSGFFFSTAPFLYLLVNEPWQLIAVRVYHGVATAIFTPVTIASIADVYKERRGEFMGYFSSATLVGRLIAPLMAGSLITIYSFREAYIACGVFGTAALITLIKFPETKSSYHTSKGVGMRVLKVLSNSGILVASTVMALTYFAMQSIETFLPLYMETIKVEPWLMGAVFALELGVITALKPYGGRLYDRIGGSKVIGVGTILMTLGLLAIAYSSNYILILISITVFAIGAAFTTASILPLISKIAYGVHGAALGAMETIKDVGQASGPIVIGLLTTYITYGEAFMVIAIITAATIALNIALHIKMRPQT